MYIYTCMMYTCVWWGELNENIPQDGGLLVIPEVDVNFII